MSNRDLRQHMADFYGDKSMSREARDRLVSLAETARGGGTEEVTHSHSGRWLYTVIGLAAGVALTLLAAPLFNWQDGAGSNPIAENERIGRTTLVGGPTNLGDPSVNPASGGCAGCERVARTGEGFCCGKGRSFDVPIKSKKLHAVLVGHKIDAPSAAKYLCKNCENSLGSSGKCDHRRMVVGKRYESPVSFVLAKGTLISKDLVAASTQQCKRCRSAYRENGWCDQCDVGFVARRMHEEIENYKAALFAHEILTRASEEACENCAVAIVTDSTCKYCKVSFMNGCKISNNE